MIGFGTQLRIRIYDDKSAYICYKRNILGTVSRMEYEYKIPLEDAMEMWNDCVVRLEKTRHRLKYKGNDVDIDVYPDGTIVIEVEFKNDSNEIPDYCGEEITNDKKYSNINIALENSRKSLEAAKSFFQNTGLTGIDSKG